PCFSKEFHRLPEEIHPDIHKPDPPWRCRDIPLSPHVLLQFSVPLQADETGNIPAHNRQIQEISADIFLLFPPVRNNFLPLLWRLQKISQYPGNSSSLLPGKALPAPAQSPDDRDIRGIFPPQGQTFH